MFLNTLYFDVVSFHCVWVSLIIKIFPKKNNDRRQKWALSCNFVHNQNESSSCKFSHFQGDRFLIIWYLKNKWKLRMNEISQNEWNSNSITSNYDILQNHLYVFSIILCLYDNVIYNYDNFAHRHNVHKRGIWLKFVCVKNKERRRRCMFNFVTLYSNGATRFWFTYMWSILRMSPKNDNFFI